MKEETKKYIESLEASKRFACKANKRSWPMRSRKTGKFTPWMGSTKGKTYWCKAELIKILEEE